MTRRRLLVLAGSAAAAAAVGGCARSDSGSAGAGGVDGETVRMAVYSRNHASSPLYWQQFAPEGLTVRVDLYTSSSDMNRAMEGGDLDFALMGAYSSLIEAEEGFRSRLIGMVSRQGIGLVARADLGAESIADLVGRTIAVPPPGAQVLVLSRLLQDAGLVLDEDIASVPLGYADHAGALERGDVDAYIGTEPPVTQSVVSGVGVRLPGVYYTPVGDLNTALWASPSMLERPELCQAAVDMQRGAAELLTPGGENDADVWEPLLVDEFGYEPEVADVVLENIGAEWDFGDERRSQVEAAAEVMLSQGVLSAEPDYDTLFELSYLASSTAPSRSDAADPADPVDPSS